MKSRKTRSFKELKELALAIPRRDLHKLDSLNWYLIFAEEMATKSIINCDVYLFGVNNKKIDDIEDYHQHYYVELFEKEYNVLEKHTNEKGRLSKDVIEKFLELPINSDDTLDNLPK